MFSILLQDVSSSALQNAISSEDLVRKYIAKYSGDSAKKDSDKPEKASHANSNGIREKIEREILDRKSWDTELSGRRSQDGLESSQKKSRKSPDRNSRPSSESKWKRIDEERAEAPDKPKFNIMVSSSGGKSLSAAIMAAFNKLFDGSEKPLMENGE